MATFRVTGSLATIATADGSSANADRAFASAAAPAERPATVHGASATAAVGTSATAGHEFAPAVATAGHPPSEAMAIQLGLEDQAQVMQILSAEHWNALRILLP